MIGKKNIKTIIPTKNAIKRAGIPNNTKINVLRDLFKHGYENGSL
jgi:hypothetical protein